MRYLFTAIVVGPDRTVYQADALGDGPVQAMNSIVDTLLNGLAGQGKPERAYIGQWYCQRMRVQVASQMYLPVHLHPRQLEVTDGLADFQRVANNRNVRIGKAPRYRQRWSVRPQRITAVR